MSHAEALSLVFAAEHPAEAAETLAAVPADASGAYLAQAPEPVCSALLGAMDVLTAAQALSSLDPPTIARVLTPLRHSQSVALLRGLSLSLATSVITAMPKSLARVMSRALHDRTGTVAGLTETDIPVLPEAATCGDALALLAANPDADNARIYLVGDNRELLGSITIGRVVAADPQAPLRTLSRTTPPTLSARQPVDAASSNEGWKDHDALPVCDAEGRFVGVVRRRSLLSRTSASPDPGPSGVSSAVAFGVLGDVSVRGFGEILEVLLDLSPTATDARPTMEDESDG